MQKDINVSWGIFLGLFILAIVIYYPGLDSRFLLDDHYNLGQMDQIKTLGLGNYVLSGIAGPSGRPLSLLSFALQYYDWPNNPFAFKLVNLLLHLLNGIIVFLICRLLAPVSGLGSGRQSDIFSLMTAAVWILHPMQVSTVLYVVQRMTELSALFTLLGVYGYLRIRILCTNHFYLKHLVLAGAIVWLCTLLGILSKENGILLPLFLLVIEFAFFADNYKPVIWKIWLWFVLILPLVVLAIYLASTLGETLWNYKSRPFTPDERILTQAVVLFKYLYNLILPTPDAFSLFHDDFQFSRSLFNPLKTFFCVIVILALLIVSVTCRTRLKVVSFAILWFFAGHALESTHLNLELYFEHRNYLPSLGIFFIISWFFLYCWRILSSKILAGVLLSAYYVLVIVVTVNVVDVWSNPVKQAVEWERLHPESPRALDNLGSIYIGLEEYENAMEVYHRINEIYPHDIYPAIKQIGIKYCIKDEQLSDHEWSNILGQAYEAKMNGLAAISELDSIILQIRNNDCDMPDVVNLMRLVVILALNPDFESYRGDLHELAAMLGIYLSDPWSALANINEALNSASSPTRFIVKIKILMAMGLSREAGETVKEFKNYLDAHPRYKLANADIIKSLENEIINPGSGAE